MEYLYYMENASLTLRVIEYLKSMTWLPLKFLTVIHEIDGWIIKIKLNRRLSRKQDANFRAFLNELGNPYVPEITVQLAMFALECGKSVLYVIAHYQVAIVSHGCPSSAEIEEFCSQFVRDLGYCPQTFL